MNMTVIIEMSEARQLKFMKRYPCYQTMTELAESRYVELTYIDQTSIELIGRSIYIFDLLDEMNPSAIDIKEIDEL